MKYIHADSFIVCIKTDDIYKDIAGNVETRFNTWNYELDRTLPKRKIIVLMRNELGRQILTKFVWLREKSYLTNGGNENEKAKDIKMSAINIKPRFENYKNCLETTQVANKIKNLKKTLTQIVLKKS